MRKILTLAILLSASAAQADSLGESCPIDIKNEVHVSSEQMSVYQQGEAKVVIDANNDVYVNGEKLSLDSAQQKALDTYHANVDKYLPKVVEIADDGIDVAKEIFDDVVAKFDSESSFSAAKEKIQQLGNEIHNEFYNNDDFVLKADAFKDVVTTGRSKLETAMESMNTEFMAGAFNAFTEKMSQEGGLNFTELQEKVAELQTSIKAKVKEHQSEFKQQGEQYCDSVKELAEEEKQLHLTIPELQNYPVFSI
ncbi:MAG: YggN family protein [Aliivibrio sp.]|uniref:DUF2884 family protein n=1 Tax=Aliivibrio sp. TaxID=1872443 RepID=UPI001A3ADB07|nr:YggN family protein [Aliivibrio sp.]